MDSETDNTELAMNRIWLAHERTLMAWVRMSAWMTILGFTIDKFFQFMVDAGAPVPREMLSPRHFAIVIVSIGLVALSMAMVAYRREVRGVGAHLAGRHFLSEAFAALVGLFGLLVLISAIVHA